MLRDCSASGCGVYSLIKPPRTDRRCEHGSGTGLSVSARRVGALRVPHRRAVHAHGRPMRGLTRLRSMRVISARARVRPEPPPRTLRTWYRCRRPEILAPGVFTELASSSNRSATAATSARTRSAQHRPPRSWTTIGSVGGAANAANAIIALAVCFTFAPSGEQFSTVW